MIDDQFRKSYIEWCENGGNGERPALTAEERNIFSASTEKIEELTTSLRGKLGFHLPYYLEAKRHENGSSQQSGQKFSSNSELKSEVDNSTSLENVTTEGKITDANDKWVEKEFKGLDFTKISKMDFAALNSKETVGEITPAIKGYFTSDIKIPLPTGFRFSGPDKKFLGKNSDIIPFEEDEEFESDEHDIKITYPLANKKPKSLAVPFGYEIVACADEDGYSVTKPTENYPLVSYNVDLIENKVAEFTIRKLAEKEQFAAKNYKPSAEEMAYWQKVLPLSAEAIDHCRRNPRDIFSVVASYVKANYQYACLDQLGDFIIANSADLPLIVDELRVGHCDLLSWVEAAYLRSLGQAAFVTSEKCTNDEGTAFMEKYGHARVAIINDEGRVIFHDPATACSQSLKYNPKYFPNHLMEKLEASYPKAKTEEEKRDLLRVFNTRLSENIQKITANSPLNEFSTPFHEPNSERPDKNSVPFSPDKKRRVKYDKAYDDFIEAGNPVIEDDEELAALLDQVEKESNIGSRFMGNQKRIHDFLPRITRQKALKLLNLPLVSLNHNEIVQGWFLQGINSHINDRDYMAFDTDWISMSIKMSQLYSIDESSERFYKILNDSGNFDALANGLFKFFQLKSLRNFSAILSHSFQVQDYDLPDDVENLASNDNYQFDENFKSFIQGQITKIGLIDLGNSFVHSKHFKDRSNSSWLIEFMFFHRLLVKSFFDEKIFARMVEEFGINKEMLKELAQKIQPTDRKSAKPEMKMLPVWKVENGGENEYANYEPGNLRKIFKVANKDIVALKRKITHLVELIDRSPRKKIAEPRYEDIRLDQYSPDIHEAKDINWLISARVGEVIAKTPSKVKPKAEPLHVYIDLNHSVTALNIIGLHGFARDQFLLESLINELQKDIRNNNRDIYLATSKSPGYLKLKPGAQNPVTVAQQLLLLNCGENVSISTKQGVPKNLIYLSESAGKVEAVKYQCKKTNLVAGTYEEFGIKLHPLVKQKWVDDGPDYVNQEAE